MNVLFDHEQLLKLVSNLYALTGIRANILNLQGNDICLDTDHAPFCERVNGTAEGHERCVACDARAVRECEKAKEGFYSYRCHAGVCEALLPIRTGAGQQPLAYLIYGQFLDDSPLEGQWENCRRTLDWWRGDPEELREAFFRFRQYSREEIQAYSEILEALSSYIRQKEMILSAERTDLQRLKIYLDRHYMEKLSLASIAAQLHVGRTKLCMLAKELSGGKTLSYMITQRRIDAAKTLLLQSDQPVALVAEEVGIGDYNYFSRLFRSVVGVTPSAFRKAYRRRGD